ncbi:MAG TPA: NAD(P)H-quinone oxidoreductase subunit 4 [Coleofasciculaceae cyanobacterium]
MDATFPWLSLITLLPLVAALPIPFLPDRDGKTIRWYALAVGIVELALISYTCFGQFDFSNTEFQLTETYAWLPQIGLNWSLAIDGISMPLVALTGLVTTLAIGASWNVTTKPRLFYTLLLAMYSAQIGVFVAKDLLLFFLMWELELVPVYLLISIWGGAKRRYAATKFILYTALASLFILVAALAMAFSGGPVTFDMDELGLKNYSLGFELLLYAAFSIAFLTKLPAFPVHTWLPDAHGEAPTPVSMLLAGVLLKMAGYGLIRMNMEMLPNAHIYFAPVLAILGVVNIIYGALNAFAQRNLKRRIAYSSMSHMGFVLLGIASFTDLGLSGAVLQMVSHGLIAAAMFFLTGVTYERTHTLSIDDMGGIGQKMPRTFALFVATAMASLALPGMSGFVGELTVFLGVTTSEVYSAPFRATVVVLAAVGVILSAVYLLSMLREIFYGKENAALAEVNWSDLKLRELAIALVLLAPIVGVGIYPKLATQTYEVKSTEVASRVRSSFAVVAKAQDSRFYSAVLNAPKLADTELADVVRLN